MINLKLMFNSSTLFKGAVISVCILLTFLNSQTVLAYCFDDQIMPLTTPEDDFESVAGSPSLVLHKKTSLMWRRCPLGYNYNPPGQFSPSTCLINNNAQRDYTWNQALGASNRVSFGDFISGWRVPNIKELQSIVEHACVPRLNVKVFPDFDDSASPSKRVWSSSPGLSYVQSGTSPNANLVNFLYGESYRLSTLDTIANVYLVRDTEADFENTIAPAFEHPRCLNCHAVEGTNFASGGVNGVGLPVGHEPVNSMTPNATCEGCHTSALQPAGDIDPGWHAAPLSNDLRNLTLSEICEKAKEVPGSANSAHDHLTEDRLVLWAFDPKSPNGGEFEAAPPYNVEAWRDAIDVWRDEGLPCP